MATKTSKSVKTLDAELKSLYHQADVVRKQREEEARKAVDLTKKFKVGQLIVFNQRGRFDNVYVYKVVAVHKDHLVAKCVFFSKETISVRSDNQKINYYNTTDATTVSRRVVNKRLNDFNRLVEKTRRLLLS